MTIGMVVPDISSPFYAAALRGAQQVLREHGYTVLVSDTEERAEREHEALTLLTGQRVAGLILAPVGGDQAGLCDLLRRRPIPLVAIDNRLQGYDADTVVLDNAGGAATLTSHLAGHGHRRIAHLTGILNESSALERLAGYRRALQEHGLEFVPDLVLEGDWTELRGSASAIGKLLDLPEPPTALVLVTRRQSDGGGALFRAQPASGELPFRRPCSCTIRRCDDTPCHGVTASAPYRRSIDPITLWAPPPPN